MQDLIVFSLSDNVQYNNGWPVHILTRQGMRAIVSSYEFKKGTSGF